MQLLVKLGGLILEKTVAFRQEREEVKRELVSYGVQAESEVSLTLPEGAEPRQRVKADGRKARRIVEHQTTAATGEVLQCIADAVCADLVHDEDVSKPVLAR